MIFFFEKIMLSNPSLSQIDCGQDAHTHVAGCRLNRANRQVFASRELFEQCQRERRATAVRAYLDKLPANIDRRAVVTACAKDFADLGIVID